MSENSTNSSFKILKNGADHFMLIKCFSDKTVRIWDWIPAFGYTERAFSPLKGHKYGITCVKVSPQGSMLATTSIDGTAVLWNLYSGTKIHTMVQMNGDAIRVCRYALLIIVNIDVNSVI